MRAVLVTGASTGIGEACALRLARNGWHVFAGVRREEDGTRLEETAPTGTLTAVTLDVTDAQQIEAAAKLVAERSEDGLSGLVNNAGVGRGGPIEYLPMDEWREQLEVNVIGQLAVTQAMLPLIRRATGRIVFMGSIAGRIAGQFLGPYAASKHALEAIAESLRHELRPWNLRVILVEPGAIKTPIWDKAHATADELEANLPPEAIERYSAAIETARAGFVQQQTNGIEADRVAQVVERALTAPNPRSRYLVGPDALVAGGLSRILPDRLKDSLVRRMSSG